MMKNTHQLKLALLKLFGIAFVLSFFLGDSRASAQEVAEKTAEEVSYLLEDTLLSSEENIWVLDLSEVAELEHEKQLNEQLQKFEKEIREKIGPENPRTRNSGFQTRTVRRQAVLTRSPWRRASGQKPRGIQGATSLMWNSGGGGNFSFSFSVPWQVGSVGISIPLGRSGAGVVGASFSVPQHLRHLGAVLYTNHLIEAVQHRVYTRVGNSPWQFSHTITTTARLDVAGQVRAA